MDDDDDEADTTSIVKRFDEICFSIGDCDAIIIDKHSGDNSTRSQICYFELQEHSKTLACQLHHRYRPDYVLMDCQGWAAAEAIATLACMRIGVPFVPISCYDQHRPGRLCKVVDLLLSQSTGENKIQNPSVVAITVCENERDPILSVFYQAGVHRILYLEAMTGSIREHLNVPDTIPESPKDGNPDDMYVLFTSGTSSQIPKAVVGSHAATYRRIHWFLQNFPSSPRVGRRSKLTFVDGVNELWTSLLDQDSILVNVPPSDLQSRGIVAIYNKCSQLLLLPSQLNQMLLLPKSLSLERVLVSGEVCSSALVTKFSSMYESCELINLYGQTESTGDVCCTTLVGKSKPELTVIDNCVAIGAPILKSIQIELGDNNEMILQGAGQLANGYLTNRALEDATPSFSSFKTGDIGFCRHGVWYVKGRVDDVVKVNGIWTNPTEIEAAFSQAYGVDGTVVAVFVVDEDTKVMTSSLLCPNEGLCREFSRTVMHEQHGIPWNIIPSNVFFWDKIAISSTGAAKVNRNECKKVVLSQLGQRGKHSQKSKLQSTLGKETEKITFLSIVSSVLGMKEAALALSKSFVELGGDSASSITLLYLMRTLEGVNSEGLTALDILNATSLQDFQARLLGKGLSSSKRQKLSGPPPKVVDFKPNTMVRHSSQHRSISLNACVDSTPVIVDDKFVYSACQGGLIIKCDRDGSVLAFTQLDGWKVQADLLYLKDQSIVIACAYSWKGRGIVVGLSTDLKTHLWQHEMDVVVKTCPVLIANNVWIQGCDVVCVLNVITGDHVRQIKLPHHAIAKPFMFEKEDHTRCIAYASSDWASCLMLVDEENGSIEKSLEYEIGPVSKDLCRVNDKTAFIADSGGSLHLVELLPNVAIKSSYRLSGNPLSPPLMIANQTCVVGGYDGMVHCVHGTKGSLWRRHVGAAVYSKPAAIQRQSLLSDGTIGTIIVSTTAGDLVAMNAADGTIQWRDRVPAEIWSDLQLAFDNTIIFGAKDSCLHYYST